MKRVAIYLRVSTASQTVENQRLELEAYCQRQGWSISQVYEDAGVSGSKYDRPALQKMLADANKGKFNVLMVWSIDRLARSTSDLLHILQQIKANGVDFVSTTQNLDTSSPMGKMVFTFLGAIAEFERQTIVERVRSGIQRAKAEGVRIGRPRVAVDVRKAIELRNQGQGYKQIAKNLGLPRTTVYRVLSAIPQTPSAKTA
jgi:DNA invertase Pin-like site-specific DNA recombinase